MQAYPAQPNNENILNTYAQDYLNNVKDNRSPYGSYVDNNLTYDPYKEQKSVYNVVYETDAYNPWGKPGGGAPKVDQTGNLKTKIVGTLKWNLNGETEEDRLKRVQAFQKNNNNVLLYKKNGGSPQNTPRQNDVRQSTTYNYNFRDPYTNSSQSFGNNLPPLSNSYQNLAPNQPQQPQQVQSLPPQQQTNDLSRIEQEAYQRSLQRNMKPNGFHKQGDHDFNRISNKLYLDNKPTSDMPNNPYWFGRAGPMAKSGPINQRNNKHAPSFAPVSAPVDNSVQFYDARRKNLLNALENRVPNGNY